jgi:hypothetical protein
MSEIKVNKISPKQTCTQLTLGDSGDTIIIPAGATITNNGTATGFGRTGTVDWDTTAKTTGFTAVSGVGYFCNTTSSAFTVTLPATPSAGAIVGICDYANTFATNNITVGRNGSNISGNAVNGTLSTNGISVTLVYVDSTQGWIVTDSGNRAELPTAQYVAATGGTITTSGNFKIHTFTGPGTFTVSNAGNPLGSTTVDYLVVAGGASGGSSGDPVSGGTAGGAGGAGGWRASSGTASGSYPVSPLGSGVSALPVSATGYPITVGAGGSGGSPSSNPGNNGTPSVFSTITSTGGGYGASGGSNIPGPGANGGSGGGAGGANNPGTGSGNTPPVAPPQGNSGGSGGGGGPSYGGGGGGGASAVGSNGTPTAGGSGGAGSPNSISDIAVTYAGGGGGGVYLSGSVGSGGTGGGGAGGGSSGTPGTAGTSNTGGGGGGGGGGPAHGIGGSGGSGIVVIRYKFQ